MINFHASQGMRIWYQSCQVFVLNACSVTWMVLCQCMVDGLIFVARCCHTLDMVSDCTWHYDCLNANTSFVQCTIFVQFLLAIIVHIARVARKSVSTEILLARKPINIK